MFIGCAKSDIKQNKRVYMVEFQQYKRNNKNINNKVVTYRLKILS